VKKRYLTIIIAVLAFVVPLFAEEEPVETLNERLQALRNNLRREYLQMSLTKDKITSNYDNQHQKMVDIMKDCNELSLRLYSQKQEYTLDLCFALEKVKKEFEEFTKDKTPYDRILINLDIEIDRYARLIESLRRLPPEIARVKNLPDSLAFHNDTLHQHLKLNRDNRIDLMAEAQNTNDSIARVFVLDKKGERDRDTCLYFATELLKMYAESRTVIMADSIHYEEVYLRLKESYVYAQKYYKLLQTRIFIEGQTPWPVILSDPKRYWNEAVADVINKYGLYEDSLVSQDSLTVAIAPITDSLSITDVLPIPLSSEDSALTASTDTTSAVAVPLDEVEETDSLENTNWEYMALLFVIVFMLAGLLFAWLITAIVLLPIFHFVKPVKKAVAKQQRRYLTLLAGILVFVIFNNSSNFVENDMYEKAIRLTNTFMWLLAAIITALLIRLKPEQLKNSVRLYLPTILMAIGVIGCRSIFVPNSMLNFILPPLLIVFFIWQLLACLKHGKLAEKSDRIMGWASLCVTAIALLLAISGYIFAALLILIWGYFQLAAFHTMTTIWHLISRYKEKRMRRRINHYREHITYVSGEDKEALLFGATWFYDLIKEVVLPVLALMSLPFCFHLGLDIFDFDDLYYTLYYQPFLHLTNSKGVDTFRLSFYGVILLSCLVFVFRYANNAIHYLWRQGRYSAFLRKNNCKSIRKNEINLSLGDSIISVMVWMIYTIVVILTMHIPTGSLSLIAGGFSAGVGLALKDIINNFIYGIQLMTGRLKIGDWIECDGVRGTVTDISYQSTQVETVNGTTVSFLNADLFAKSFTNLTKSNSYEFLKITLSVAYGTDIQRVREIILDALQVLRTKDAYGREMVEPKKGIYLVFGEFGESGVEISVKQFVLAAERIAYADRAKELIYNALNANGITIPFPQRDIHVIQNEE
jgi:small-conductance mechanosensitive channel